MPDSSLNFPEGPWKSLLKKAFRLLDSIESDGFSLPRWSLGGGTVLMFHYAHRKSKDIDIFVPDPQFLGYVNPRLGGRGEDVTSNYKNGTEFVKLFLPEGEIDFVASATLTENPFEEHNVLGRDILLETPIEIVAKKLWYRGDRATSRDLLDLALVIERHYNEILAHGDIFAKNIEVFSDQCDSRRAIMIPAFNMIEKIESTLCFDECLELVNNLKVDLIKRSTPSHISS